MAYTAEQIAALIHQGESGTVEFKTRLRDGRMLGRLVSAFANADGGVILIGVGDNGEVIGTDIGEVTRAFHLALANIVNPPKVDLEATVVNGKAIATITIGASDRLTVADTGAFRRAGSRVEPMAASEIVGNLQDHGTPPEDAHALADAINKLTEQISQLQEKVDRANSIRGQLPNYFIGGLIGAVFGALLAALF